jgi:hypothetical protein
VLEKRGLLARAVAIHSGDLDVKLAPAAQAFAPRAPRDPIAEGDKQEKRDEDLLYASS